MRHLFISLSFLCLIVPTLEAKNEVIIIQNETYKTNLGKQVYFLRDPENRFTFEDISREESADMFNLSKQEIPQFGYTNDTMWFRLKIKDTGTIQKNYLLEFGLPGLDYIEFYQQSGEMWTKKTLGDSLPYAAREFDHRSFLVKIDLLPKTEAIFYLKIKTTNSLIVPFSIHESSHFFSNIIPLEAWHYSFYGILCVMIFYNGFICLAFRSLTYFLYSSSTFFLLLFYAAFNGHGYQYLWPEFPLIQNYSIPVSISVSWYLVLEFSIRFLELSKISHRLFLIMRIFQIITILIIPFSFYSLLIVNKIQGLIGLVNAVLIFLSGAISWRNGYKAARFFVIGWSLLIFGILLLILKSQDFIPTNFFTTYTMQIGSLFELVFLSLALADRYKFILEESNKVQKELLQTQIKHSETLEEKVAERTKQLNHSLDLIKQDLSVAKKIQQNTLMINYHLIEKLEIIPFYLAMSEVGGDFYGINKVNNKYRLFLADATGHGVQAALITMAIKGIYDNIKNYDLKIPELLEIFNEEFIHKYASLNTFLTCIIADIDIENGIIEIASAGHPACLLIKNDKLILLEKTGRMIGIKEKAVYESNEFAFIPGDRLYFFTDGVFEEFNDREEEFGEDRLHKIFLETRDTSLERGIQEVIKSLDHFLEGREKQDDITILGVEYKV